MRVTKSYIKQLVKEELTKVLSESVPTDSARRLMKWMENVYMLPEDEEEYNKNWAGKGNLPATFEEYKANIEKETGEPYAKVLSFYNTMRSDTYDRIDSEYLGKHDKYGEVDGTVKPYNWNKMGDERDYGRKNRQVTAAAARRFRLKQAIQSGTLKESGSHTDFLQDAQKIINALLAKGSDWTANVMRAQGRDTFYDHFGDVALASAYEQIKGRDNAALTKIRKRFATLLADVVRDKFGGDGEVYNDAFRRIDIALYKGVNG